MNPLQAQPDTSTGNKVADEGNLFVCCACGKTSTTRYGFGPGAVTSPGWDESCMLNAQEFPIDRLVYSPGGRVREVKAMATAEAVLEAATSTPFKDKS